MNIRTGRFNCVLTNSNLDLINEFKNQTIHPIVSIKRKKTSFIAHGLYVDCEKRRGIKKIVTISKNFKKKSNFELENPLLITDYLSRCLLFTLFICSK